MFCSAAKAYRTLHLYFAMLQLCFAPLQKRALCCSYVLLLCKAGRSDVSLHCSAAEPGATLHLCFAPLQKRMERCNYVLLLCKAGHCNVSTFCPALNDIKSYPSRFFLLTYP